MYNKESFLSRIKSTAAAGARTTGAGIVVSGLAAGFNPSAEVSVGIQAIESSAHLVLDKSPFDFDLPDLNTDLSTEDADKIVMTAFVSAYMIGLLAQVRKNLEIAHDWEKLAGWSGAAIQSFAAAYGVARVWEVDFGNIEDELDKAAISGFITGYIGTKAAITWRGMSNGLPWTKAIGEAGVGAEAVAGAYGIARVTKIIE